MKTIAVMNQKGGTGKTTSAINLAGELVRRGKKVLIVDMDTQGNATSNLSLTEIPAATLTDVIVSKNATLADTVCHTTTENLDLIRGGSLLAPALATMQEMPFGRDTTLRRLLPQIPDTYDFVFFDCSPSLESLFNINVLVAVQYVLIPIKVECESKYLFSCACRYCPNFDYWGKKTVLNTSGMCASSELSRIIPSGRKATSSI